MSRIAFEMLHVPVPSYLMGRLTVFKDGCLSIEGVRLSVIGTKAFFHVLTWEDVLIMHRLNVNLGEYIEVFRRANPDHCQKLMIRRIQYASKCAKQQEKLRGRDH